MRALQVGLRVRDLERSLAFYIAVGYMMAGTVQGDGIRQSEHAPAAGR
jgi:lactoylglutathione lyase